MNYTSASKTNAFFQRLNYILKRICDIVRRGERSGEYELACKKLNILIETLSSYLDKEGFVCQAADVRLLKEDQSNQCFSIEEFKKHADCYKSYLFHLIRIAFDSQNLSSARKFLMRLTEKSNLTTFVKDLLSDIGFDDSLDTEYEKIISYEKKCANKRSGKALGDRDIKFYKTIMTDRIACLEYNLRYLPPFLSELSQSEKPDNSNEESKRAKTARSNGRRGGCPTKDGDERIKHAVEEVNKMRKFSPNLTMKRCCLRVCKEMDLTIKWEALRKHVKQSQKRKKSNVTN